MVLSLRFSKEELHNIGCRLHSARVLTGMSREDFAAKIAISPTSIKSWELGRVLPRHEGIVALINAFKECGIFASPEWILYGSGMGPNYIASVNVETHIEGRDQFADEQVRLFKNSQRAKGYNPVVVSVQNQTMAPVYKSGDVLGGIIVPQEFVRTYIVNNGRHMCPWLVGGADNNFAASYLYLQQDKWFTSTEEERQLKELTSFPTVAKIKWHYALGEKI